jgi:large subunit ribosomal protein L25
MQSINLVSRRKEEGFVPCVVYGKAQKGSEKPYYNKSLSIPSDQLKSLKDNKLKTRAIPITINFEDEEKQVSKIAVLKAIQFHPIKNNIIHLDFFIIDGSEEFEVLIPIRTVGKENSIAIKEGAVVNQMFKQIKAHRNLSSLTEEIVVDVSNLRKKDIVRANDLNLTDIFIKNNPVILTIL